jgi:hypothetical protein
MHAHIGTTFKTHGFSGSWVKGTPFTVIRLRSRPRQPPGHLASEERFVSIWISRQRKPLVLVHTTRGEQIRLITLALRQGMKGATTKKHRSNRAAKEMRPEYDFSGGVRGKYAARYSLGLNVILLEIAGASPNSKSVNDASRALLEIADRTPHPKRD